MRVKYSPTEQSLLDLLLEDTSIFWDIHQLTDLHYRKRGTRPWNGGIVVNKAIAALIKKTTVNRENFTIQRIEQVGKTGDLIGIGKPAKRKSSKRG